MTVSVFLSVSVQYGEMFCMHRNTFITHWCISVTAERRGFNSKLEHEYSMWVIIRLGGHKGQMMNCSKTTLPTRQKSCGIQLLNHCVNNTGPKKWQSDRMIMVIMMMTKKGAEGRILNLTSSSSKQDSKLALTKEQGMQHSQLRWWWLVYY